MTARPSRRLATLSEEIAETTARLAMLRDLLEARSCDLDESHLRMLIAETPLAGRDLHVAAGDYLRVQGLVRGLEALLAALHAERARLAPPA